MRCTLSGASSADLLKFLWVIVAKCLLVSRLAPFWFAGLLVCWSRLLQASIHVERCLSGLPLGPWLLPLCLSRNATENFCTSFYGTMFATHAPAFAQAFVLLQYFLQYSRHTRAGACVANIVTNYCTSAGPLMPYVDWIAAAAGTSQPRSVGIMMRSP